MNGTSDKSPAARSDAWPPVSYGLLLLLPRLLYRVSRRSFSWLFYEKRLGVITMASGAVETSQTVGDHVGYHPSRWRHLRAVLRGENIGPEDVFLDLGAGLGRIVIQAAQMPFQRVIGVELSPELSATARTNVNQMRASRRCGTVEIVVADAGDYEIPDDVTVVYLYNPFTGTVFERVVENLCASIRRNPRSVRVVYTNPVEEALLHRAGARLERTITRWRPSREWARREETRIYSLGRAARPPSAHQAERVTGYARTSNAMVRQTPPAQLSVRRATDGDQAAIQRLGVDVFANDRSAQVWQWHFQQTPAGPTTIYLLVDGDRVVGHHAHSPFDLWSDGTRVRLALSHELMIDPAYRGRGGTAMLSDAFLADGAFDARIGFPYDHSAALLADAGMGRVIGRVPRWVHPLAPERHRRRVAHRVARAYSRAVSRIGRDAVLEPILDPGSEFDELADESAQFARCMRVRHAAYLRWRWLDEPGTNTKLVAARQRGGELRGFVAWDVAVEGGVRHARVLDLLARDFATTRALLVSAARQAKALGATRVEFLYNDPRRWSRAALISAGFLPAGTDANVLCGSFGDGAGDAPLSLRSWYLTRGDIDFDATAAQPTPSERAEGITRGVHPGSDAGASGHHD